MHRPPKPGGPSGRALMTFLTIPAQYRVCHTAVGVRAFRGLPSQNLQPPPEPLADKRLTHAQEIYSTLGACVTTPPTPGRHQARRPVALAPDGTRWTRWPYASHSPRLGTIIKPTACSAPRNLPPTPHAMTDVLHSVREGRLKTLPNGRGSDRGRDAPIGAATVRSCKKMRPQAGVGKLKHAPPLQANDLLVVAQAVSPANRFILQLLRERFSLASLFSRKGSALCIRAQLGRACHSIFMDMRH